MPTRTRSKRKARRRSQGSRERCSLNRREAAYFADTSLRQVDKAIEEKILKARRAEANHVYLQLNDVVTLALITRARLQLPRQTKMQIYDWVSSSLHAGELRPAELALNDNLVILLDSNLVSMARDLDTYVKRRERYITVDPEIQEGEPVITGTRLPASAVAERLRRGDALDDLAADYPGTPKTAFEAARIYAAAHPRRGRPTRPWRDPS